MDARFAEGVVRKWQSIKSQALGPDHCLGKLPEVRKSLVYWHLIPFAHIITFSLAFNFLLSIFLHVQIS